MLNNSNLRMVPEQLLNNIRVERHGGHARGESAGHWVELRSSVACTGFVSSNPLLGRSSLHVSMDEALVVREACQSYSMASADVIGV